MNILHKGLLRFPVVPQFWNQSMLAFFNYTISEGCFYISSVGHSAVNLNFQCNPRFGYSAELNTQNAATSRILHTFWDSLIHSFKKFPLNQLHSIGAKPWKSPCPKAVSEVFTHIHFLIHNLFFLFFLLDSHFTGSQVFWCVTQLGSSNLHVFNCQSSALGHMKNNKTTFRYWMHFTHE